MRVKMMMRMKMKKMMMRKMMMKMRMSMMRKRIRMIITMEEKNQRVKLGTAIETIHKCSRSSCR
jgi:hypothetical protein